MSSLKRFKARLVLTTAILAFLIGGCVYDPHHPHQHGSTVGAHHYYDPYDYYYYPGVRVYFHFSTGYYYYHDRTHWLRVRVLPSHIHLHPDHRVRLKIKSEKPYHRHSEHKKRYTPKVYPKPKADKKRSHKEREANRKKRSRVERESNRKKYEEHNKHKGRPDKSKGKKKDREKDKKKH